MANPTGVTGQVTIPHEAFGMLVSPSNTEPTDTLHLFKWSASIDRDVHDVSNWGSPAAPNASNARETIGGMMRLAGTCEGYLPSNAGFDLDPTYPVGVPVQKEGIQKPNAQPVAGFILKYHEDGVTDREITFVGLITNLTPTSDKTGLNTYSLDFVSHGNITGIT